MAKTKTKTAVPQVFNNSIVGTGVEAPDQLLANPMNYRRHTQAQRDALRDMLKNVGWIQNVIVNRVTGHLVDGHLRVDLAMQDGETGVPVVYVELSPEQERLALAGLDPIAAQAKTDPVALKDLLQDIDFEGDSLASLLTELTELPPLTDIDDLTDLSKQAAENKGTSLSLVDVCMDDPKHDVQRGQIWALGDKHVLFIGSVHTDWKVWSKLLNAVEGAVFAPYPTPMLAVLYDKGPLVMVQPDEYLAGHVLDKWASRFEAPELVS